MDCEELKQLLRSSGVNLWALIDTAIEFAVKNHEKELKTRRDSIVERLYSPAGRFSGDHCRNCHVGNELVAKKLHEAQMNGVEEEEENDDHSDDDDYDDDEKMKNKIFAIKEFLEDSDVQSEDSIISLLQNLADMNITFKALKETDIGRNVNGLRKHSSNEVRRLVKHLVRKWKETVDEWVKSNSGSDGASPAVISDGDSPQQNSRKLNQNNYVRELQHSPNSHNGYLNLEPVLEHKTKAILPRREAATTKPNNNINQYSTPFSATPAVKEHKDNNNLIDPERLASARKRLHENYQEAENAKKQRTIQVMDINEIPKKSKHDLARKGGFQAKHNW